MMYDAGNAKHVDERKKKARLQQRLDDEYFRTILAVSQGRSFMFGILARTGLYRSSFSTNGKQMAFNEGERNIGLALQADIVRVYPEALILMMREADERSNNDSPNNGSDAGSGGADTDGDTTGNDN